MTPLKVHFTDLTVITDELGDQIEYGIIPEEWVRYRFTSAAQLSQVKRWLTENIEGRFAVYARSGSINGGRAITVAFERKFDASMFVISDGMTECLEIQI